MARLTSTGWLPDVVLREAGSNLWCRRGRYSVLAVLVAALVGGLVWAEMSAADAALDGKRAFLAAGGTVVIAEREQGGLDAARCAELSHQSHVAAAGGLVRADTVSFDHAPRTPFQALFVSGDLVTVLDPGTTTPTEPGLVMPNAAATELGVVAGSWLSLAGTPHRVAAVVRPEPRAASVSRSILLPEPPTGRVDQCWVEFIDGRYESGTKALPAWFAMDGLTLTPLIDRNLGTRDFAADWASRTLRHGWVAAGVLVGAVAGLLVWRRRAEMVLYVLLGTSRVVVAVLQTVELWLILAAGGLLGILWGAATASVMGTLETEAMAQGIRAGALTVTLGFATTSLLAAWLVRTDLAALLKERPG